MRVSQRVGRRTTVSMGCGGWLLVLFVVAGLIGWGLSALGLH